MSADAEQKPPTPYDIGHAASNLLEAIKRVNECAEAAKACGWSMSPSLRGTDYGEFPLDLRLER